MLFCMVSADMHRMYGAMDKHAAKKGIMIYADKLSSVARKVSSSPPTESTRGGKWGC